MVEVGAGGGCGWKICRLKVSRVAIYSSNNAVPLVASRLPGRDLFLSLVEVRRRNLAVNVMRKDFFLII